MLLNGDNIPHMYTTNNFSYTDEMFSRDCLFQPSLLPSLPSLPAFSFVSMPDYNYHNLNANSEGTCLFELMRSKYFVGL